MFKSERFFFSSRGRHTRYIGDWSSDVCSSDLLVGPLIGSPGFFAGEPINGPTNLKENRMVIRLQTTGRRREIGRASCRERVVRRVVGVSVEEEEGESDGGWWLTICSLCTLVVV